MRERYFGAVGGVGIVIFGGIDAGGELRRAESANRKTRAVSPRSMGVTVLLIGEV